MNRLNSILVEGNLVWDPEFVTTEKGTPMCTFTIATNRYYIIEDRYLDEVSFFEVKTWSKLAKYCEKHLKKGKGVQVVGRLKQDRWVDTEGKKTVKGLYYRRSYGVLVFQQEKGILNRRREKGMKEVSGKITISRSTSNVKGDYIEIRIRDKESASYICEASMDLESFASALTGLAFQPCSIKLLDSYEKAGKKLITKSVFCLKSTSWKKEDQRELVLEDFNRNYKDEWELHDDGTGSQQPGYSHHYVIQKYIDKE